MKRKIKNFAKKIFYHLPISANTKETILRRRYCKKVGYKKLDKGKFYKKISKYDIISFDIFDTLITRLVYEPDDIFYIMQNKLSDKDFLAKRKQAERVANEKLKKDVNLDEIYIEYKKLYNEDVDKIKKLENKLEINLCIPRIEMREIFNRLCLEKKKVILVSDMYLTKETIEKMLKKCGYSGYSSLYISNDINKRKDTKEAFTFLLNKYSDKRIIHIGDNDISDVIIPQKMGINAIKIYSPRQMYKLSSISKYTDEFTNSHDTNNSLFMGLLVNKNLFNSPFSNIDIDTLDKLTYSFYSPILEKLLKEVSQAKTDELLFLAREGYNLESLYVDYCKINKLAEIKHMYFLSSRKSVMGTNFTDEKSLLKILDTEYIGNLVSFFYRRFDMKIRETNFDFKLPADKEMVKPYLLKYKKQIIKKSEENKIAYTKYIEDNIKNYRNKNLTIIDLGYSGTIQYELSKMLGREFNGIYATNSNSVKRYSKHSNLKFVFDINENKEYEKIYSYSLLLEFFLSAPYGQLQYFNIKNGKSIPVYNDEIMDENKKKILKSMYKIVIEYFKDVSYINKYVEFNPNKNNIIRIYTTLIECNMIRKSVKDKFTFMDDFTSEKPKNVFKIIDRY